MTPTTHDGGHSDEPHAREPLWKLINLFSSVAPAGSAENIDLARVLGRFVEAPAGEQKFVLRALAEAAEQALVAAVECVDAQDMRLNTPGGVFHVRRDDRGGTTAMGQLPFFAEYLNATGLFEDWLQGCPLGYVSPNAPGLVDVLGTWMLSILDGHHRYAHVGVLRGDGVAPSILSMKKIIGDDSLRRALSAIAPAPDKRHTVEKGAAQEAPSSACHAVDAGATHAVKKRGRKSNVQKQAELALIDQNETKKNWEYAVLVCDTPYKPEYMGRLLYRDRADCRTCQVSGFDEIKNQRGRARTRTVLWTAPAWRGARPPAWRGLQGWGGYSTHDIERCALSARAVALIYNWWSWYVRLANPKNRMEAITSRPKLLSAVGRMTSHGGSEQDFADGDA